MDLQRLLAPAWRPATVAVAISATLHGAALTGIGGPGAGDANLEVASYSATLEPPAFTPPAPPPAESLPAPRPAPRPRPRKTFAFPDETLALLPASVEQAQAAGTEPAAEELQRLEPLPEVVALAKPAEPVAPPEIPAFRPDALPAEVTIAYSLTSAFADGDAEYTWTRDGERYEITGTARATGFFTIFLEGHIYQAARGRVTAEGLRPESFTERRGATPEEGLAFDWDARQVEFRRGDSTRSTPLTDSTVDWLSMIFQLAHMPPKGDTMPLRVFTQRRLYEYRLQVVGPEDLELPFGTARTLHLRHAGAKPEEAVDVWLGVDQHYLPVKLRYPVARNRVVVEQTATSVKAR